MNNFQRVAIGLIGFAAVIGIFFLNRGQGTQVISPLVEPLPESQLQAAAFEAAEAQTGKIVEEIGSEIRKAEGLVRRAQSLTPRDRQGSGGRGGDAGSGNAGNSGGGSSGDDGGGQDV